MGPHDHATNSASVRTNGGNNRVIACDSFPTALVNSVANDGPRVIEAVT